MVVFQLVGVELKYFHDFRAFAKEKKEKNIFAYKVVYTINSISLYKYVNHLIHK